MTNKQRAAGSTILRASIAAVVLLFAATMIFPFLWMLSTSLKVDAEVFTWPPRLIPRALHFENYATALTLVPFGRFFVNSFVVTVGITAGTLLLDSLAGYVFAKFKFTGRELLFFVLLASYMVPLQSIVIPIYQTIRVLHWQNTFLALIIPNLSGPLTIFLMRQFIMAIPDELIEAARVDGMREFRIFTKIILPCSKPALATLVIFQVQYHWNDYFWPLIMTSSTRMKTVQLGLSYFTGQVFTQWNLLMAAVITAVLPLILLFLLMQRYFIEGITLSGIKG